MNMVMNMDRWRDSRLDRLGRWMEERERQREREKREREARKRGRERRERRELPRYFMILLIL